MAEAERAALLRWTRAPALGVAPRTLAVVAHPDDEVVGLGGRMSHVAAQLHVAYVSDGAPDDERWFRKLGFGRREQYATARRAEARLGLALAGLVESQVHELAITDQRVTAALARVVEWLLALIPSLELDGLLTHAYEGGHPDHDATACAVHVALERLGRGGCRRRPLWEFASYHAQGAQLVRGRFVPVLGYPEERVELGAADRERKLRLIECHATQREFLNSFPLDAEHFRVAPRYDFTRPPPAPFFYDRLDWGISGANFLLAAQRLLQSHNVSGPC